MEAEGEDEYTYLQNKYPHTKDGTILFKESTHKYTFILGDGTHVKDNVVSTTEFLSFYSPPFPPFAKVSVCKSVNMRFKYWFENRTTIRHPRTYVERFASILWPEKYDAFVPIHVFHELYKNGGKVNKDIWPHPLPEPLGRFTPEDVEQGWTRAGTELHHHIERWLNWMPSPVPAYRPEWNAVLHFMASCEPRLKWIRTEMRIGLPEMLLAGSIDALAQRLSDGRHVLFDWKNSRKLGATEDEDDDCDTTTYMFPPFAHLKNTSRNKYYLQQTIYRIMLQRAYGYDISEMVLVVFPPGKSTPPIQIIVPNFELQDSRTRAGIILIMRKRLAYIQEKKKKQKQEESTTRKRLASESVAEDSLPLNTKRPHLDATPPLVKQPTELVDDDACK